MLQWMPLRPHLFAWATSTGAGSFAAWLHRIVVNRALDHLRRERRFLGLHVRALTEEPDWEARGVERDVADAVRMLRPDRRAVVVLHHLLGYSLQETAELVGAPIGTVQSRLVRALGELRERLGVNDD